MLEALDRDSLMGIPVTDHETLLQIARLSPETFVDVCYRATALDDFDEAHRNSKERLILALEEMEQGAMYGDMLNITGRDGKRRSFSIVHLLVGGLHEPKTSFGEEWMVKWGHRRELYCDSTIPRIFAKAPEKVASILSSALKPSREDRAHNPNAALRCVNNCISTNPEGSVYFVVPFIVLSNVVDERTRSELIKLLRGTITHQIKEPSFDWSAVKTSEVKSDLHACVRDENLMTSALARSFLSIIERAENRGNGDGVRLRFQCSGRKSRLLTRLRRERRETRWLREALVRARVAMCISV